MEYRRTTAISDQLSILVVSFQFPDGPASNGAKGAVLGDAAKAIARKLREKDSIYVLGAACFGAILPGVEASAARGVASRIAEGLVDAAGVNARFTYKIDVVNYPQNASSAHQLYEAVTALIPQDHSVHSLAAETLA